MVIPVGLDSHHYIHHPAEKGWVLEVEGVEGDCVPEGQAADSLLAKCMAIASEIRFELL